VVSSPARWRLPRTARAFLAAALTQTRPGRWMLGHHVGVRLASRWTRAEPPVSLAERLRVPLAVVHGAADRMMPASEASFLAAAAGGPHRLVVVPGMGHAFDTIGHDAVAEAVEWVLAHRTAVRA
jgi:pimeloyl-ACP methyl ester carboxylesterase